MEQQELFYSRVALVGQDYTLASSNLGLVYVGLTEAEELSKFFPKVTLIAEDHKFNQTAASQLAEYFAGERQTFSVPLDLQGTNFQQTVWQELLQVPFGEIQTYSQLAEKIERPEAVRAVANAVGRNPLLIIVPCHRILGKDGSLTGFRGGIPLKITLLKNEGVTSFH